MNWNTVRSLLCQKGGDDVPEKLRGWINIGTGLRNLIIQPCERFVADNNLISSTRFIFKNPRVATIGNTKRRKQ